MTSSVPLRARETKNRRLKLPSSTTLPTSSLMVSHPRGNTTPSKTISTLEQSRGTFRAGLQIPSSIARLHQSIHQSPASPGPIARLWRNCVQAIPSTFANMPTASAKRPTTLVRAARSPKKMSPTFSIVRRHRRGSNPSTYGFTRSRRPNF